MTRIFFAAIAVVILVGAVLAASGVLHVRNDKDESGVTIDKKELKEKTQEAVKKTEDVGGKVLEKTGDALHNAAAGLRGSSGDKRAPESAHGLTTTGYEVLELEITR